jgi:hypothetical protein
VREVASAKSLKDSSLACDPREFFCNSFIFISKEKSFPTNICEMCFYH